MEVVETKEKLKIEINRELYDAADDHTAKFVAKPGINEEIVRLISRAKNEPGWMLEKRLKGLKLFFETPMPTWGPDLSSLDLDNIVYFVDPNAKETDNWQEVPEEIKKTFDRLGIPEAEKNALAGVGAQYDSSVVYHNIEKSLKEKGVIFENMDVAMHTYPELVQKYFMTSCIPIHDHKFIMLHAAVWSGGTFIYVPKDVKVELPLQAYFRMNAQKGGQFEHTLIIVDEGAELHYIEGCSSPRYQENSLHAGCVELHVLPGAKMRYTSIENWSKNVYNLNTKRAMVHKGGRVEWINANMGCLTGDTEIFTNPKGPVEIKDIQTGDKLFVWDSKTNTIQRSIVTAKIFSGIKQVYKLQAGGRDINATANHPFLTLTRKKNNPLHKKGFFHHEWKALSDLKVGDVVAIAKRFPVDGKPHEIPQLRLDRMIKSKNQYSEFEMNDRHLYNPEVIIPKMTDNDFMWLTGILLGDGSIHKDLNKINIALHVTDSTREVAIEVIEKLFNYTVTTKDERSFEIQSKVLAHLFAQMGFSGNASTKRIPQWVYSLPKDQILSLLAGYIDSDGHVCGNALACTSINIRLLQDVRALAIACGFGVSRIFKHREKGEALVVGNLCPVNDSWRILLNGPNIHDLPIRHAAKREKVKKIRSRRDYSGVEGLNLSSKVNDEIGFATIQNIVPLGEAPTYDIEVEGHHNFVANGLIVHNSHRTMLYPCSVLIGENAQSESLGIAFAGPGQDQDTGSKVIHAAPHTSSIIRAKSISKGGGISSYRGMVQVAPNAKHTKSNVQCDALLLDEESVSKTYPYMKIDNNDVSIGHEAKVGKIGDEQVFYLMSRGLSEEQAVKLVVNGFIEPIVKALPLEYAIELNKLIELEIEGF